MTSINIRIQNGPKPLRGGRNQIFQNPDIAKKGGVWPTAPTCNGDLKVKFGHIDRNQSMGTQKCSLDILTEIIQFCEIKRKTSISVKHTLDSGCTDFSRVLKTWNRENGDIEKNGDPKTEKGPQWQWQWNPNSDQFSKKKVINFSP